MNFDDYARHIYQKHRLAVALAILKSKPTNEPTSQYLVDLKSKVNNKMDDDDITVCSDDFNVDDEMNDSVNILKDFDLEHVGDGNALHAYEDSQEGNQGDGKNASNTMQIYLPEDLTQTTFYGSSVTRLTPNITHEAIVTNNKTFYEENLSQNQTSIPKYIVAKNKESNSKIKDFDHNKSTEKSNQNSLKNNELNTQRDSKSLNIESNPADMDSTYYDSQKTVLYTVHGFTEQFTHYSPSQNDIIIPNKYMYGTDRNKNIRTGNSDINKENNIANVDNPKMIYSQNKNESSIEAHCFKNNSIENSKMYEKSLIGADLESSQTMNMFSLNNDENFNQIQDSLDENNIHSNRESVIINNTDTLKDKNNNKESRNTRKSTQFSQNIYEYFEEMQNVEGIDNINSCPTNRKEHTTQNTDMEITDETFITQNIVRFSQNIHESSNQNEFEKEINKQDTCNLKNSDISKTFDKNETTPDAIDQNVNLTQITESNYQLSTLTNKNDSSKQNNDKQEELIAEEESEEVISYKVLEEFNKVKTFLNRQNRRMSCDGYSTDSGYRSDSQIRSSNRSALQLSGNWLNQSGCCLFNYIMQCHLVAATRDITNEIAQVLSQLIDRLHEEEKYPSFLEDLLETVDVLLRRLYEGESSGDSEFLIKDETIQRVLLLNKSIHIQKHSIEKISNILEIFHSNVTDIETTYELTNIDQIENISYIFHILEILLKKYLKCKDMCSQSSTQLSQEEKTLKKSSITDIWRKKWNPNHKVFEGSREKKCILKICSEILNRIVVDCVGCYSLVAYSALKCFNSMQS